MTYELPVFSEPGNCIGIDTEVFFPETLNYENLPALKAVCNNCPVISECLEYALRVKVQGFWAGTTEIQRRHIRKRRKIVGQSVTTTYTTPGQPTVDL